MHALTSARAKAYARDCLGYLGIAAAMVPAGMVIRRTGLARNRRALMLMSVVPPIIATLVAAGQESGEHRATPGKRSQRLAVRGVRRRIGFGRALVRNSAKILVPWQLGHVSTIGALFDGFDERDPLTIGATAAVYPLMAAMGASVALGEGRAIHDRLAGTRVRRGRR